MSRVHAFPLVLLFALGSVGAGQDAAPGQLPPPAQAPPAVVAPIKPDPELTRPAAGSSLPVDSATRTGMSRKGWDMSQERHSISRPRLTSNSPLLLLSAKWRRKRSSVVLGLHLE